jgi:hypothetical protein
MMLITLLCIGPWVIPKSDLEKSMDDLSNDELAIVEVSSKYIYEIANMKCTGTYRNNIEPYKVIPTLIFMHADSQPTTKTATITIGL